MRQLVPGADLTDRRVQTHGGTVLGRVEDLLVHVTEGRVSHVVVRLERRWGLHRRYYLVPWRRLHVTFGLQAMVFDGDLRDLARAREVDGEPGPEDLVVLPEGPLRRRHEAPMAPG